MFLEINNKRTSQKKKMAMDTKQVTEEKVQVTETHERCSSFLITTEMQIKTTVRCQFVPDSLARDKELNSTLSWQGCGETAPSDIACGSVSGPLPRRGIWQYLSKSHMFVHFDQMTSLLGIHYTEVLPHMLNDLCIRLFMATFCFFANYRKQSKCPSLEN